MSTTLELRGHLAHLRQIRQMEKHNLAKSKTRAGIDRCPLAI